MSANISPQAKINKLKDVISEKVFVTKDRYKIVSPVGRESRWLFDFRNIFLKPDSLDLIAEIFWEKFGSEYPFQVGGQETAAIPLIAAIVVKSKQKGKPVNGFFIRKSRKPDGLQKVVEGDLNSEKIILIDDLLNSGNTVERQLQVLKGMDKKVSAVFTLLRFRSPGYYTFLEEEKIKLFSLFSLGDFGISLKEEKNKPAPKNNFEILWHFQAPDPNFFYVVPKSIPVLDENKLYFGSDGGIFWALGQKDGLVAWQYRVGFHPKGKGIFSSPVIHEDIVYFGTYDGNVYALDANTGRKKWIFMDADWVGSSPALAPSLNLLFIGLEFGIFRKKGGIVALDLDNGEKRWGYAMPEYVHSSPAYSYKKGVVAIGGNDNTVYLFRAKDGKLIWNQRVGGEVKASLTFSEENNVLFLGAFDGKLHALDLVDGKKIFSYQTGDAIYSTPLVCGSKVLISSMDKHLYCLDVKNGKLLWKFRAGARILSSPTVIEGHVFIGANDGRLNELNLETGEFLGFFQTIERLTSKIVYNKKTRHFFVSTYANEIYCIARKTA